LRRPNLTEAKLAGANISDVSFRGVKTTGAHFDGADLSRSLFEGVNLSRGPSQRELLGSEPEVGGPDGADLRRAKLSRPVRQASLNAANCEGADFTDADLELASAVETDFSGACLDGAKLRKTELKRAIFLTRPARRSASRTPR
jgi:uncharacterized protein YjbI with pentapeptide repeats